VCLVGYLEINCSHLSEMSGSCCKVSSRKILILYSNYCSHRNVLAMTDIKTHIGYARAWVRLSLEKKVLSKHLRTLLSDSTLLRYDLLQCFTSLPVDFPGFDNFAAVAGACTSGMHSSAVRTRRSSSCTTC